MRARSITGNILRNSFWYGLETVLEVLVFLGTSVAVARALGPEKLGHYTEVSYPIMVLNSLAGTGMAAATRKYMADHLAAGDLGMARAVYRFTANVQWIFSAVLTLIGLAIVLTLLPPEHRLMAVLLVLSIVPGMMSWVPAQANLAFEDASKNTISSLGYIVSYAVLIALTLRFHWDLPGIAAAMLIGRLVEAAMRMLPLQRTLRSFPAVALPAESHANIRRFCLQAIGVQMLVLVVWGRSELFFLTALAGARQVAFYGVSSTIADKLLLAPSIFATATGISLMAEAARDPNRLDSIIHNAVRLLSLLLFPLAFGAAAISSHIIAVAYGPRYLPAVPVVAVAVMLAIPKAFQTIPDTLLRAADRQTALVRCLIVSGIVNVALDYPLVRYYGAMGAAIGNGVAQAVAVGLLWRAGAREYRYHFPALATLRLLAAALLSSAAAYLASHALRPLPGLAAGIAVAAPVYVVLVRVFHALEPGDYPRLNGIARRLPGGLARGATAALQFAIHCPPKAVAEMTRAAE